MAIEFLERWAELLKTLPDGGTAWHVSDFWFGQSLAHSAVLLEFADQARHARDLESVSSQVLDPTLVVWLDVPAEELFRRVRQRGRAFEAPATRGFLDDLRQAFARILMGPSPPPCYRPQGNTVEEQVAQLVVVAKAITG